MNAIPQQKMASINGDETVYMYVSKFAVNSSNASKDLLQGYKFLHISANINGQENDDLFLGYRITRYTAAKFPREKSLLSVGLFLRFCAKILSTHICNADAMRAIGKWKCRFNGTTCDQSEWVESIRI